MQIKPVSAAKGPFVPPVRNYEPTKPQTRVKYEVWEVDREGNLVQLKASRIHRTDAEADRTLLNSMGNGRHIIREWYPK
jgi:hypothetical protein